MAMNGDTIGRYFLVLIRMRSISVLLLAGILLLGSGLAQETPPAPAKLTVDKRMLKNFAKSLILPGWGQWENGDKVRGIIYLTAELAGIYGYQMNHAAGNDKELAFKAFGDEHWSYSDWLLRNGVVSQEFMSETNVCGGNDRTHQMPYYYDSDGIEQPIKDHHFYENISKYPEFVCGWDDISEKDDEDLTPNKAAYIDMRTRSNQLYRNAQIAGTLIMVNHLISAFDAALGTDITAFETSSVAGKVYINPLDVSRGISMEVKF